MLFRSLKPTAGPIAVDFGESRLKVLQLAHDPQTQTQMLLAAISRDTPPDLLDAPAARLKFQAQTLADILRSGSFRGRRAVCAVPSGHTFVHHIQILRADNRPIEEAVAAEIGTLTGRDVSNCIIRHSEVCEVTRAGTKRTEVICTAMPREAVIAHMKALRSARLDPSGIHSEHAALIKGITFLLRPEQEPVILIIDIGRTCTRVCVSHGGALKVAKVLPMGGQHLQIAPHEPSSPARSAGALRTRLHVLESATESTLAVIDPAAAAWDGPLSTEAIDALADEIAQSIRYHQALFPDKAIAQAILVGGESARHEVSRRIARNLGTPTMVADALAALPRHPSATFDGMDPSEPSPAFAVALGLSLMPTTA